MVQLSPLPSGLFRLVVDGVVHDAIPLAVAERILEQADGSKQAMAVHGFAGRG